MNSRVHTKYDELIISSGGIKGCYIVGALEELNRIHPIDRFTHYTGTSVGGVICCLIVMGYTMKEINDIFIVLDWSRFIEVKLLNFMENLGFDNGLKICDLLKANLILKNFPITLTFKELYEITNKVLTITVCNFTKGATEYHSVNTTPDMSILLSVRMSINIPILFEPIRHNGCLYLDGAVMDHFPYYHNKKLRKFGICLLERDPFQYFKHVENEEYNMVQFFAKMIQILWENQFKRWLRKSKPENTIYIVEDKIEGYDFNLDIAVKRRMKERGRELGYDYMVEHNKKVREIYLSKKYINIWKDKIKK